ncbi:DUF4082 domain-containing protein [Phytohabitans houttuyneae]|uniref:DUF4082 domain-containing protein n=1 Tax=Phytohabitans houttuyneae TaxID=1076126 RepID=UPI0015659AC1|nr:DUF4082 domain-containing protein [Phytohabitans houttuyneae]
MRSAVGGAVGFGRRGLALALKWYSGLRTTPRRLVLAASTMLLVLTGGGLVAMPAALAAADPCNPVVNPIVCENSKDGSPRDQWDVDGVGDPAIQGFATDISVNAGQRVNFKISTTASSYDIDIYRLGWYDGDGARKVDDVNPSASLPQLQDNDDCVTNTQTEIFDCGTWAVSAFWDVPATAVSGVYIARLQRPGASDGSHIPFVVRNDASHSALFFQTSDTTWQAYNSYGGSNFYSGGENGRAYKLSYNRPFATRGGVTARDYLFSNEYPMIRFLERNGYDMSYTTGVDSDRRGNLIQNHQVFLSVGHDEYWSGQQRANVEAARDAGVSLAFFSGNEVYWKTRWETSVDGAGNPYRTLVCYKETWANDKIDPSSEWTGTWRDPRFSPPSNGGKPENALTGTMFQSNNASLSLQVPAEQGDMRLWRNTGLDQLTGTQVATLAPNTVGYESNEDIDNGFRPAGLIRLSKTVGETPEYLRDFGSIVTPGTTTHNLTLYRAESGALVFSAGSIQWAWGLDEQHDGVQSDPDDRMQQATINLLADMGALPATRMSTLDAVSTSTDTTAPSVTVTSPAQGASFANGAQVTVQGTATDTGGRVAGVEVSTDGGTSWHPANGTTAWSYSFYASGVTTQTLKVRAVDDSANIQPAPATRQINLTGKSTLFGARVPANPAVGDDSPVEVGVKVVPQTSGYISGIRFYKGAGNTGTHNGTLWNANGGLLATGTFSNETATGWQTLNFSPAVPVIEGRTYVASYYAPNGHYAADPYFFTFNAHTAGPLVAPRASDVEGGNGVYGLGAGFPTETYQDTNYYVDVLFTDSGSSAPVVVATSPLNGATGAALGVNPSATFSKSVVPVSVQFTLKNPANQTIAGTKAYNDTTKTVTFTPSAPLAAATEYTATVSASDNENNPVSETWSFTTDVDPSVARLFAADATPATAAASDGSAVTLGVRFTPSQNGQLIGLRFYQGPGNTGTHSGSIWSSTGSRLRQVTFPEGSGSGWQTALFDPLNVTAGTEYVVSYFAPNGRYAINTGFFDNTWTNGPLSAPGGTNGVYVYGSDSFPENSYNSSNYWVDPLFMPSGGGNPNPTPTPTTPAPSPSASPSPTVTPSTSPTASPTASPSPTGSPTPSPSPTPTVPPVPLPEGALTLFPTNATPDHAEWDDRSPIELGMTFRSDVAGQVLGVRFYKGPQNTGTHTGSLWDAGGTRRATGTFVGETASGWQNLIFDEPFTITPNTAYTVSYYTPSGWYAVNANTFQAGGVDNVPLHAPMTAAGYLYGTGGGHPSAASNHNYWVDVIFKPTGS